VKLIESLSLAKKAFTIPDCIKNFHKTHNNKFNNTTGTIIYCNPRENN
jgi:hypothetical protein